MADGGAAATLKGGFLTRRPACFSPDGRLIYVPVSTDIRVYSALSGEHVGTLRGHKGDVTAVVLDPSAAAAGAAAAARPAAGAATPTPPTTTTTAATRLYSASADGTLRHWDAATGECLAVHAVARDEGVESFAISAPLGVAYCVVRHRGGTAGRVQAVALLTGEALAAGGRLKVRRGARLAVSPSGAYVAVLDRNSLFVWSAAADLADAGLIGHAHLHQQQRAGQPPAPPAPLDASTAPRRRVKPLNLHHSKAYTALAFDPNDGALAAGDASGRILLWHDFAAAVRGGTLGGRGGAGGGQQSAGSAAPTANPLDGDDPLPPCTTVHWHASAVGCLAFSADGAHLLSGGAEGVLVQWHVASGKRTYLPRLGGPLVQVLPSPADGARLLVAQADNTLRVVNSAAMRVEATVHGLRPPPAPAPAAVAAAAAAMAAAAAAANAAAQGCATAEQRNAVAAWWWRAASLVPPPWQSATATAAALHPATGHLVLPCENAQLQFFDAGADRHVGRMQVAPRNAVAVAAAAGVAPAGGAAAAGGGGWVAQGDYANYQQHQRQQQLQQQQQQQQPASAAAAAAAAAPGEPQVTHVAFASAGGGAMATVDVRPDTASAAAAALAAAAAAAAAAEGPYDASACAAAAAAAAAAAGGASSLRLWDLVGTGGGGRGGGGGGGGSGAGSGFALAACIDAPHAGAVTGLAAHPTQDVVATCSDDGEFKVWARGGTAAAAAPASWRCASVGGYKRRALGGAAFSPDGSLLAIGAGTTATLWDPVQCRLVAALAAPPLAAADAAASAAAAGPIVRLAFVAGAPGAPPRLVACTAAPHARIVVWDLLTASAAWAVELETTALAADPRHAGVFAVGVPPQRPQRQQSRQQQAVAAAPAAAPVADGPASPAANGGTAPATLAPPTPPVALNKQQQQQQQQQQRPQNGAAAAAAAAAATADATADAPPSAPSTAAATPCGHVLVFDASSPAPRRACAVPGASPPCALLFVPRDAPLAAAAASSAPRGLSPLLVLTADRRYAAVTSPGRRAVRAAAAAAAAAEGVVASAAQAAEAAAPAAAPASVLEAVFGKTPVLQQQQQQQQQHAFDAEGLELLAAARGAVKGLLDAPSHALPAPKAMCEAMLELLLTGGGGGGGGGGV
jgi:NET1-associated nuclear protein 1 (U3 small nucleolar RNA-associated protein 17)